MFSEVPPTRGLEEEPHLTVAMFVLGITEFLSFLKSLKNCPPVRSQLCTNDGHPLWGQVFPKERFVTNCGRDLNYRHRFCSDIRLSSVYISNVGDKVSQAGEGSLNLT